MYGAMFEGRYYWISDANNGATVGWFPIFNNFFRSNDKLQPFEGETDQAANLFFRWVGKIQKQKFTVNLAIMIQNLILETYF